MTRVQGQDGPKERSRIRLNWHQDLEAFDTEHRLILHVGGYRSGKSTTNFLILLDRSRWDTGQRHAIFANTINQLYEGILPDMFEWLERFGIEHTFGSRPPKEWVRLWKKKRIPFPQRGPRSPHTWIWKNGLHVVCGGLANGAYKRYRGFKFGSIIHEEFTEQPNDDAFRYLWPRLVCGDVASGKCARLHRHQYYARGNPPDPRKPHWLRDWKKHHENAEEERERKALPPFFRFIQSSTWDNVEHVGTDYIEGLQANFDKATADAMVNGELVEFVTNRTYYEFSEENIHPVAYDPARPLYVSFDFNSAPSAATLGQDLLDHELPEKFRGRGLHAHGVFGEIFDLNGMDATQLARALLRADENRGGHWPLNFRGLAAHQERVYIHGDPSGNQKRIEAPERLSAWVQIMDVLRTSLGSKLVFDVPKAAPTQFDSVGVFNSFIHAANGDRRYFVSPIAEALIRDLKQVTRKDDGTELIDKSKDAKLTHISDAERYKIHRRFAKDLRRVDKPNPLINPAGHVPESYATMPRIGRNPLRRR